MNHTRLVGFPTMYSRSETTQEASSDPCTDTLSDVAYLQHMIPHHQVALDMSHMMIPHTTNPQLLDLCRQIIQVQGYEIWEMTILSHKLPDTVFSSQAGTIDDIPTKLERFAPKMSQAGDGTCDPKFFKPNDHKQHMAGMDMNMTMTRYLSHMIPHHQVAIDMSKRLLLHTNNSYLIDFCRHLIIVQEGEIFYMNSLLLNTYNYDSELLSDMSGSTEHMTRM
jgi:uncharacterized protein (DUF305 family)